MINRALVSRFQLMLILVGLVCHGQAEARAPNQPAPLVWSQGNVVSLLSLYTQLHQHPELSFHEKETAARIAQEWRDAGFQVTTGVGGHGVVAVMRNGAGPTLMLRTDLDALPVTEQTGLAYASKVRATTEQGVETGVMHACGHDIHMTNLVGVARYLAAHRPLWSGTLLLVGQPAEERAAGALRMIKDGLFKRFPKPDFAVAFHVDSALETGSVGYRAGHILANVDSVDVVMRGRGGQAPLRT